MKNFCDSDPYHHFQKHYTVLDIDQLGDLDKIELGLPYIFLPFHKENSPLCTFGDFFLKVFFLILIRQRTIFFTIGGKNVELLSSQIETSCGQNVGSSEFRYFNLESCAGDLISISSKQNFFNNTNVL